MTTTVTTLQTSQTIVFFDNDSTHYIIPYVFCSSLDDLLDNNGKCRVSITDMKLDEVDEQAMYHLLQKLQQIVDTPQVATVTIIVNSITIIMYHALITRYNHGYCVEYEIEARKEDTKINFEEI